MINNRTPLIQIMHKKHPAICNKEKRYEDNILLSNSVIHVNICMDSPTVLFFNSLLLEG